MVDVRKVKVTNEYLSVTSGYEGEVVTYHAIVKDDESQPLPLAFIADLEMDGIILVDDHAFTSDIYNSETCELTLDFVVPPNIGLFIIRLTWLHQTIELIEFSAGRSSGL